MPSRITTDPIWRERMSGYGFTTSGSWSSAGACLATSEKAQYKVRKVLVPKGSWIPID